MRALLGWLLFLAVMAFAAVALAQNPAPVKSPPFALSEDYPYEDVEVMMPDTVLIHGRLYDPSQLLTSVSPHTDDDSEADVVDDPDPENVTKYPLVILIHGLNGTHADWGNLPEVLVKKGYAVLAMDLRGHGESDRNIKGHRISWRTFKGKQWEELPRDVDRVVRYLKQEQEFPQVDTSRVALVGAKLGGNVAIIAASRMKAEAKSLVILSAGINYKGLDTSRAIVTSQPPLPCQRPGRPWRLPLLFAWQPP